MLLSNDFGNYRVLRFLRPAPPVSVSTGPVDLGSFLRFGSTMSAAATSTSSPYSSG